MELAPVLVEAKGRRIGAVRDMRWEDIEPRLDHIARTARQAARQGTVTIAPELVTKLQALTIMLDAVKRLFRESHGQSLDFLEGGCRFVRLLGNRTERSVR